MQVLQTPIMQQRAAYKAYKQRLAQCFERADTIRSMRLGRLTTTLSVR